MNFLDYDGLQHYHSLLLGLFDPASRHDFTKVYEDAVVGEEGTIYFTTDTHEIVLNGQSYSSEISEEDLARLLAVEKDVADIQEALKSISGEAGSVKDQIDAAIKQLDLPNTYETKSVVKDLSDDLSEHISDDVKHITSAERTAWNEAKTAIDTFLKDADMTEKAVDTLAELQTYMTTDGAAAAELVGRVADLEAIDHEAYKAADTTLETSLKSYADQAEADALAAAKADAANLYQLKGDYATVTQVTTAENNAITHANNLNAATGLRIDALVADKDAYKTADTKVLEEAYAYTDEHINAAMPLLQTLNTDLEGIKSAYPQADTKTLNDAKAYTDEKCGQNAADIKSIQDELNSLSGGAGSVGTQIDHKISELYKEDTAVNGQYVSSVTQANGVISVHRTALPDYTSDFAAKANASDLTAHTGNTEIHITAAERTAWNAAEQNAKDYADGKFQVAGEYETAGAASAALEQALAYTDTLANGAVKANTDAINVLNGTGTGSVSKQVTDAIAAVVANAPSDLDTLKEIADYIAADKTNAATLVADVDTLKGQAHTHDNKTVLDTITSENVSAWNHISQQERTISEALNDLNARTVKLEGIDHSAYATSDSVYTKEEVDAAIGGLAIPSIEGLASESFVTTAAATAKSEAISETRTWVRNQNYLTEHQNLDHKQDVITDLEEIRENAKQALKVVPDEFVTDSELTAKGYLTSIPEEYVTEEILTSKNYLTSIPDEYVTDSELQAKGFLTAIPEDYATKGDITTAVNNAVEALVGTAPDTLDSIEELATALRGNKDIITTLDQAIAAKADKTSIPTKTSQLENDSNFLTSIPDIYVTKTEHEETEQVISASLNNLNSRLIDLDDTVNSMAGSIEVPTKVSQLENDANYITDAAIAGKQDKIDDLETIRANASSALKEIPAEYITESELQAKGYLTAHQDISGKQDKIDDLASIRENAAKGATALQSVPAEYITETELAGMNYATIAQVNAKQDAISDLAVIRSGAAAGATALQAVPAEYVTETEMGTAINTAITNLIGNAPDTLNSIEELADALKDNKDIVSVLEASIANKADKTAIPTKVSDLTNDSNFLTSVPSEYVTESELNSKGYLTSHQDISGKANVSDLTTHTNNGDIHVTAAQKTAWTNKQNAISDLATIRSGAAKGATALQSFTETDPIFSASVAANIKESDITNWNSKTSNTGTVTGIKMNGSTKGTSGVVDLGTVITSHQDISGKANVSDLTAHTNNSNIHVTTTDKSKWNTAEQNAKSYADGLNASMDARVGDIEETLPETERRLANVENGFSAPDARNHVLWIGTSIPAGDIQHGNNGTTQSTTTDLGSNNYPKMVADALGFKLYNNARGSSFVCFYPPSEDGTSAWAGKDWSEYSSEVWKGYSLSASFAQVDEKFGPNGLNCPQWLINNFKSYSYESLIIPYIDGTLASCDTVIIDHGYNDRKVIINEASWHPGDGETQFATGAGRDWLLKLQDPFETTLEVETYFQGKWWNDESVSSKKHYMSAIIFLAKKIWAVNPKIKIIIGNYFASKSNTFGAEFGNDRLAEFVNLANSACASWLRVNCVDIWKHTGIYNRNLPAGNDFQLFCPDGVHPHSDSTGHSNKIIAGVYINAIRGTLYI